MATIGRIIQGPLVYGFGTHNTPLKIGRPNSNKYTIVRTNGSIIHAFSTVPSVHIAAPDTHTLEKFLNNLLVPEYLWPETFKSSVSLWLYQLRNEVHKPFIDLDKVNGYRNEMLFLSNNSNLFLNIEGFGSTLPGLDIISKIWAKFEPINKNASENYSLVYDFYSKHVIPLAERMEC